MCGCVEPCWATVSRGCRLSGTVWESNVCICIGHPMSACGIGACVLAGNAPGGAGGGPSQGDAASTPEVSRSEAVASRTCELLRVLACTVCGRAPAFTSRVSSCAAVCAVGEARAAGVWSVPGVSGHTRPRPRRGRASIGAVEVCVCVFVFAEGVLR